MTDNLEDDGELELHPRTARQTAERFLALVAVAAQAHQQDTEWVRQQGVDGFFSMDERAFFFDAQPAPQEVVNFSWRAEALCALCWALGGGPGFPALNQRADIWGLEMLQQAMAAPGIFIDQAQLRPAQEIEEMEAHLYQQHWRVRDAQLFNKPVPEELCPSIVYERRYALSWLVGWGDDWDEVPTDT